MKMNRKYAAVAVKVAFGSLLFVGVTHMHAVPAGATSEASVQNLNTLSDGHAQLQTFVTVNVDGEWYDLPVCAMEDCSDQPNMAGAWRDPDTGKWWVTFGEDVSYPVHWDKVGGRVR